MSHPKTQINVLINNNCSLFSQMSFTLVLFNIRIVLYTTVFQNLLDIEIYMTSIEHYDLLLLAIKNSNVLSSSQKEILIHLHQFKEGLSMSDLVELMGQSKQTLFLKVKKLLDRGFVLREKDMVFMYKVNQQKMSTLLENYQQLQNHKVLK